MTFIFDNKSTKVNQLADYLSQLIIVREYMVGEKLPSINELTRKYNVSRDTVFKAFLELKERGMVDSLQGKSYYVASQSSTVLLLLDEYTPFKDVIYKSIVKRLPETIKVDLWFHQYNEKLFNAIVANSVGRYTQYLIMNYKNDEFSQVLEKVDPKKLLLLDFGKFDKEGYSYICQNFDESLYEALVSINDDLKKYEKLVFIINKSHKHPRSSKEWFLKFCKDHNFKGEFREKIDETTLEQSCFYLVIKQEDVVDIIKQSRQTKLKFGKDAGLLAYNDMSFYEIIDDGISSMSIDWEEMGRLAADFILKKGMVQTFLKTKIIKRNSFWLFYNKQKYK